MGKFEVKLCSFNLHFSVLWRSDQTRVLKSSFSSFLDHTQRRTTVGRPPVTD